jgi:hypothetical protein
LFANNADKVNQVSGLLDELLKALKAILENVRRMRNALRLLRTSQFRLCQKVEMALSPNLPSWKAALDARIAQRRQDQDQ